ncbi:vacuolar ATP synthase catalytic subunit [Medicago truncatula]|uniref:Vacuolar ATP synthase catalytic subunit n=1 Tax=Medicago truncatula TaxID=3880 RepID=A0A072VG25_MEDTR|nr:vacuolar ATP synthase catalytic subunit [Medicago truncatula]
MASPPQKSNLISCEPLVHISDIKLIRTDTTLDLSQKAEKVQGLSTSRNLISETLLAESPFKVRAAMLFMDIIDHPI